VRRAPAVLLAAAAAVLLGSTLAGAHDPLWRAAASAADRANLAGDANAAVRTRAAAQASAPPARTRVLAAYFADYDANFNADEIPAGRLTDVIYAFGAIDSAGRCTLGDFAGVAPPRGLHGELGQLELLEARYPKLETEISIGGWSGSARFSAAASSAAKRRMLVSSCIDLFLRRWPGLFDGIDIDWEFPVAGGLRSTPARPSDRADATALLAEFRRQLDALGASTHRHYLLTAALPAFRSPGRASGAGSYTPAISWNLAAVARSLDWINLMTYDMAGGAPVTDFESALRPTPADPSPAVPGGNTIEGAVAFYEAAGVPASSIVVGAPFYGHVFTHVPRTGDGLFQHFRKLGATPSYAQIVADYLPTFQHFWSPSAQEPWLYSHPARQFISYDNPAAMAAKARYILAGGLRGAMIWEISMDDSTHDLLNALADPLLGTSGG
jgi:chitinase